MKSHLYFGFMKLAFRLRDAIYPRRKVLQEAGIRPGFNVLDYGCGTGSYIRGVSEMVGESGTVHALDVDPLAIEEARRIAAKSGLENVRTILSDCVTGLPDESIDVALLYDVFHALAMPGDVLAELHRVLKPDGILSFSDHHLSEEVVITRVQEGRLFTLLDKGRKTNRFAKKPVDVGTKC